MNKILQIQQVRKRAELSNKKWKNLTLQAKATKLANTDAVFHGIWLRVLPLIRNFNEDIDHLIKINVEHDKALSEIQVSRSKFVNAMPQGTDPEHKRLLNELSNEF